MKSSTTVNYGISREEFFRQYGKAIDDGTAAVFAGAGLSRAAGYVDWKGFLRDFAVELGLDLDVEQDLVSVAQYHLNANNRDRSRLNQRIIDEFSQHAPITPSHMILARLPIRTFWTTNYDEIIEEAMKSGGKKLDVKKTTSGLTTTRPGFDAVLYKMHGDLSIPESIIITRDDFERYSRSHTLFLSALQSDLVNKTFLFLGFSFTDPNLDHVLGQLRAVLGENPRTHFCIMRRENPLDYKGKQQSAKRYEYEANKQRLRVNDLQRYGIQTVLVDGYDEIPGLLAELERRYYRRSILVSGASADYGPLGRERLEDLCQEIGTRIIAEDYNLVSGFGTGIGSPVIMGALEALYQQEEPPLERRLRLRPFPQTTPTGLTLEEFQRRYREDMIANVGFVIFISGNRLGDDGKPQVSPGVLQEFSIAGEQNKYPIPVAVTGWAAEQIWREVAGAFGDFFPSHTPRASFNKLAKAKATNEELVEAVFDLIHRLTPRPIGKTHT